jgi:hypothetical protein
VAEFSSSGTLLSSTGGYTGGGNYGALGHLALDNNGDLLAVDLGYNDLEQLKTTSPTDTWVDSWYGYAFRDVAVASSATPYTFYSFSYSNSVVTKGNPVARSYTSVTGSRIGQALAADGSGNVWVVGYSDSGNSGYLDGWSSIGTRLAPATTGFTGAGGGGESGNGLLSAGGGSNAGSAGVAADGSGNVWVLSAEAGSGAGQPMQIVEFVGLVAPVQTPVAAALKNNTLGQKP